jgi:hypothetical protein
MQDDLDNLSLDSTETAVDLEALSLKSEQPVVQPSPKSKSLLLGSAAVAGDNYVEDMEAASLAKASGEEADVLGLIDRIKNDSYTNNVSALESIFLDETITDEVKQEALKSITEQGDRLFSLADEVTVKAMSKADTSTQAKERFQLDLSGRVQEINDFKARKQAAINAISTAENPTTAGMALDTIEMIVTPFGEQKFIGKILSEARGGDKGAYWDVISMLGSTKEEFREQFKNLSVYEREMAFSYVLGIVEQNKDIILPTDNYLQVADFLDVIMGEEDYTTAEKWFDNIFGWLELTIVGGIARKGAKSLSLASRVANLTEKAEKAKVRNGAVPSSTTENVRDTSPEQARELHQKIIDDDTDDTAEALSGTNRTDAIADAEAPEIANTDGSVKDKPYLNSEIEQYRNNDPMQELNDSEIESARQTVKGRFNEAPAYLVDRVEMSTVSNTPTGIKLEKYYGPEDYGWSDPEEAFNAIEFGLRDLGVTEDMLTLMVKKGDTYVPISKEKGRDIMNLKSLDVAIKGEDDSTIFANFLVKVDYDYKASAVDITKWEQEGVTKLNIFDRFSAFTGKNKGSFTRHLLDPASIFKGRIFRGASVAVDRSSEMEKRLLDMTSGYSDIFARLPKERQQAMDFTLKEDNLKGLDFDRSRYQAAGHTDEEIDAIKAWRNTWDTMYWLENRDLVDNLVGKNYRRIVTATGDTSLYGRKVANHNVPATSKVYDPVTDTFEVVNPKMLDKLKEDGGYIAALRRPSQRGEEMIEYVRVEEKMGSSYSKRLVPSDQVLNHRKGYFTTYYNAPQYVVQKVTRADGTVYEKAVATAGNTLDATRITERMNKEAKEGTEFFFRGDIKNSQEKADLDWDMQSSLGRTTQRVRGERLDRGDGSGVDIHDKYVDTPIDSLIRSVRSLSRRVSVRDWLENSKTRFVDQYSDVLLSQRFGESVFPSNMAEIGQAGVNSKKVADAKTTYEYIKYMEEGYINSVDDFSKAMINSIGSMFAGISTRVKNKGVAKAFSKLERGAQILGDKSLTGTAKGTAFQLYLAMNPVRQLLVQGHQGVQLTATHTKYVTSQALARDMTLMYYTKLGGEVDAGLLKFLRADYSPEQLKQMFKEYQDSGLASTIDKSNLLRGSLNTMIEDSKWASNPVSRAAGSASRFMRKSGFDAGEEINIMSSWLAHRNQIAKAKGKFDLNLRELGDVGAKARNFTYGMNAAGDMPYNLNWLSIPFQFLQVPHKSMLAMTLNKGMTFSEKTRLAVFNAVFYTLPPAAMYSILGENIPDDPMIRDMVVQGMEGYLLNLALSNMVGEEVGIDISSLAPLDMYGTYATLEELISGNIPEAFSKSPSGSLFFGTNPRISNLMRTTGQFFDFTKNDDLPPAEFADLGRSFAELFSGMSNAFKTTYALKYKEAISSSGSVNDEYVNSAEAVAMSFGLPTLDQSYDYYIKNKLYKDKKEVTDDVREWVGVMKQILSDEGVQNKDKEYSMRMISEAWRVFGDDELVAREAVMQLIKTDALKGDDFLRTQILKTAGYKSNDEIRTMIRDMPSTDGTGKVISHDAFLSILDEIDKKSEESKQ